MLELRDLSAGYGQALVLRDASLQIAPGEIHGLMGRNGAGKTTLIRALMGLIPLSSGQVMLDGNRIDDLPAHQIPRSGVGLVPQGRRLFAGLTVAETLDLVMATGGAGTEVLKAVLDRFPRLQDRMGQRAETLSGGEQQMLAMARALMLQPKVLLLDEPSEGLQPSIVAEIHEITQDLRADGVAIMLVEQRADVMMQIADHISFLEQGRLAETLTQETLKRQKSKLKQYLGV